MLHGVDFSKANALFFATQPWRLCCVAFFLRKKEQEVKNGSKFYERETGHAFGDHDGNPHDDLHAGQFSVQHH